MEKYEFEAISRSILRRDSEVGLRKARVLLDGSLLLGCYCDENGKFHGYELTKKSQY